MEDLLWFNVCCPSRQIDAWLLPITAKYSVHPNQLSDFDTIFFSRRRRFARRVRFCAHNRFQFHHWNLLQYSIRSSLFLCVYCHVLTHSFDLIGESESNFFFWKKKAIIFFVQWQKMKIAMCVCVCIRRSHFEAISMVWKIVSEPHCLHLYTWYAAIVNVFASCVFPFLFFFSSLFNVHIVRL